MDSSEETSVKAPIDWEQKYTEDMRKKEEELKSYRYRVLGVSELARQLEEKKEQVDVMKQKISRLEITLVRVENRASSLEKKLKSSNNANSDASKTTHIPGPSKQILDTLLAENNKLKTALNNLTNKGHSGYITAVKIDQLEGVIEQQRVQISDLKEQINSLTASPDGDSSPVALQRQIQKLNKSIKMKDEFCSILSLELKKVQDELRVTKEKSMKSSKDVQDGQSKDSGISSEGNAEQETSPEAQDWQRKCELLQQQFEEQRQTYRSKEQRLIKLVSDKEELFNRESRGKNEALENCTRLKQQIDQLKQQLCAKVNSANYDAVAKENAQLSEKLEAQQRDIEVLLADKARLLSEKKRKQETLADAASVGGGVDQTNQLGQLQRELDAVRHEAESVRVERDELKEQNDEYMDNIAFLQDRLKQGEAEKRTLEARIKNLDLNVRDLNGQLIRMGVRNTNINPRSYHDNFVLRHPMYMQPEIVVKDGGSREQQQSSQSDPFNPHCGQNVVDTVRRPVGVSRAPPNNPRVMQGHINPHGVPHRMDQWTAAHPGHFPAMANHNQGVMFNNPAVHQQGNPPSFMSLPPQQYRGHRTYPGGDVQYPPSRSPDAN